MALEESYPFKINLLDSHNHYGIFIWNLLMITVKRISDLEGEKYVKFRSFLEGHLKYFDSELHEFKLSESGQMNDNLVDVIVPEYEDKSNWFGKSNIITISCTNLLKLTPSEKRELRFKQLFNEQ